MRLIHTSDLQIGKAFGNVDTEVASILQDARQAVIRKLGELAVKHQASMVLISGDIYDKQQLSQQTLAKPIEAMRPFTNVTWHLMPGNHDHFRENGLWDRLGRMQLPANVRIHTKPGAVKIAEDNGKPVFLLPSPLSLIRNVEDLSSYMDKEPTPDGSIRIGMAHGSVQGFGSEGETSNYVSPTRPESAGLVYLAMGDWHRQMKIKDRVWYSGTPEPDQFRLAPQSSDSLCNGGSALLVEIAGPRALPSVTPIETGRYCWHSITRTLLEDNDIDLLENDLRALDSDLDSLVLNLQVSGTLSLAGRKKFEERIVEGAGAAMRCLRLDDSALVLEPTQEDMDEIGSAGFMRVAANRLKNMAEDETDRQKARLAALALKRLYLEHLKHVRQI